MWMSKSTTSRPLGAFLAGLLLLLAADPSACSVAGDIIEQAADEAAAAAAAVEAQAPAAPADLPATPAGPGTTAVSAYTSSDAREAGEVQKALPIDGVVPSSESKTAPSVFIQVLPNERRFYLRRQRTSWQKPCGKAVSLHGTRVFLCMGETVDHGKFAGDRPRRAAFSRIREQPCSCTGRSLGPGLVHWLPRLLALCRFCSLLPVAGFLRRDRQEDDLPGYFDAVSGLACRVAVEDFTAAYSKVRYALESQGREEAVHYQTTPWVDQILSTGKVARKLTVLRNQGFLFITETRLMNIIYHIKAITSRLLTGWAAQRLHVKQAERYGYSMLCRTECHKEILKQLQRVTEASATVRRALDTDLLSLFLFHWTRVIQATEASLERVMAAVLLRFYHACGSKGGKLSCNKADADRLGMDPSVFTGTPESLNGLIQIKARHFLRTVQALCIRQATAAHGAIVVGSAFESDAMKCCWSLQDWTNGGSALPRASSRGQLEIWRDLFGPPPSLSPGRDALEFLEITSALVNSLLNPQSAMPGNNSYLLSQTLWIQARELQSGLAGFSLRKNSRAVERLAPLLYWLSRGTPEPGLKDQYSPLTSVTLQAVAYLHSYVEGFARSMPKRVGRRLGRGIANVALRLIGRRQRTRSTINSWKDILTATQLLPRLDLTKYRGAMAELSRFATEFRQKFLGQLPVSVSATLMVVTALWIQQHEKSDFSFANTKLARAKIFLWLMAFLHPKGHVGVATDSVLAVLERHRRPVDEMNVGFAAFVGDSRGNLPRLNSRTNSGRVKLTPAGLEAFFTVLSAATTNPMDVIRMGVDLATTLDVQLTQASKQKSSPRKRKVLLDPLTFLQTEASIRFHCANIRHKLAQELVGTLRNIRDPEAFQGSLNEYMARIQVARIAIRVGRSFEDISIVCPFMPTYLNEGLLATEQRNLYIYAISRQTTKSVFLHRIIHTKLAFVPVFTPIATVAWIAKGVKGARARLSKLSSMFRRTTAEARRLRQIPTPPAGQTLSPDLRVLFSESRVYVNGLYTSGSNLANVRAPDEIGSDSDDYAFTGELFVPKKELEGSEVLIRLGNIWATFHALKKLGYH
ncbi:transmembrane protein, partial [Cystoisospora suis]